LAVPHTKNSLPPAKIARAKAMLKRGYSIADVSYQLGVNKNTLTDIAKGIDL